jgi:hypothetical protein
VLADRCGERARSEPVAVLAHGAHRDVPVAMVDDRRQRPAGKHRRAARQQHQRASARVPLARVDQPDRLHPDPAGARTEHLDPSPSTAGATRNTRPLG